MISSDLLSTNDAAVWAKEFCEMFGGNTVNGGVVDIDLMRGWFANAMAAQETASLSRVHQAPESDQLKELAKWLDAEIAFHADETVNRIAKGQGEWGARHRYVAGELAKFRDKLRAIQGEPK